MIIIAILWGIGLLLATMLPSFLHGRRAGQGRKFSHDDENLIEEIYLIIFLWPLLLAAAIVFGPFILIFYGIGKLLFKLGKLSA